MNYQIRLMRVEDIYPVMAGEQKVFSSTLGYDLLYNDLTLNPYAVYLVLEIEKEIKGYIGMWVEDQAQIINFYVDPEYQHMGFGSLILEKVIALCEQSGANSISLEVRVSNTRAINLYKKFGFYEAFIRKEYYDNKEDAIVMIKSFEVQK